MQLKRSLPIVGALLWPAYAFADDSADLATARALGIEGVTLADAGNCRDAIDRLVRAEALHHAPTTAVRLGECEIATGKLVSGTERLNRVVREPLAPNAPAVFSAAVSRAQKALDTALPRIATLRISLRAPAGVHPNVTIDGEPVSSAVLDGLRQVDPGSHRIEITAPGHLPARGDVTLADGQTSHVTLELKRDPAESATPLAEAPVEVKPPSRSAFAPALAFGVGALGLSVGLAGAVIVARKSSRLDDACGPDKLCPESSEGDLRDAKTWATVSTVAFGVAGAAAITGTVLLLTSGRSSVPREKRTEARVRPLVGLGSVGLHGVF